MTWGTERRRGTSPSCVRTQNYATGVTLQSSSRTQRLRGFITLTQAAAAAPTSVPSERFSSSSACHDSTVRYLDQRVSTRSHPFAAAAAPTGRGRGPSDHPAAPRPRRDSETRGRATATAEADSDAPRRSTSLDVRPAVTESAARGGVSRGRIASDRGDVDSGVPAQISDASAAAVASHAVGTHASPTSSCATLRKLQLPRL